MDVTEIRTAVCPECGRDIRVSADVTAAGAHDIFRRHYHYTDSISGSICPMSRQPVPGSGLDPVVSRDPVDRGEEHACWCPDSHLTNGFNVIYCPRHGEQPDWELDRP